MTRKRFQKMMVALMVEVGKHGDNKLTVKGSTLKFYRDKTIDTIVGCNSYEEAWAMMMPLRKAVGMK